MSIENLKFVNYILERYLNFSLIKSSTLDFVSKFKKTTLVYNFI